MEGTVDAGLQYTSRNTNGFTRQIIRAETAEYLKQFMKESVETGTSRRAKPMHAGAGAKTATAQTGRETDGVEEVQSWFAGFTLMRTLNMSLQFLQRVEQEAALPAVRF